MDADWIARLPAQAPPAEDLARILQIALGGQARRMPEIVDGFDRTRRRPGPMVQNLSHHGRTSISSVHAERSWQCSA